MNMNMFQTMVSQPPPKRKAIEAATPDPDVIEIDDEEEEIDDVEEDVSLIFEF